MPAEHDDTTITPRQREDSFTIDDLKSASFRQTSVSISTDDTCTMQYSSDIDSSFMAFPVSPVSICEDEQEEIYSAGNTSDGASKEISEQAQKRSSNEKRNSSEDEEAVEEKKRKIDEYSRGGIPTEISTPQSDDCNQRQSRGQQSTLSASADRFLDGMKLLIEKGADINLQVSRK